MSGRSKQILGDSPIGLVLRALRVTRGVSLEETARLADVSAANLSRTERGLPGGVHPRHLERISGVFGTSVVALYALAEAVAEKPDLLDDPAEVAALTDRLAELQRAYLRASPDRRDEVDRILGL
ncbi:MAG: helix-turn-helix transcriptional regulator [Gammaproteobacteria bacterium]|nr:helix-turn-helix transcriptional regulator [Gammaproteobacteria bacterium]